MPSTYTLISSNVLSSSAASVTFSAIPSTYTDLLLRTSIRTSKTSNNDNIQVKFNSTTSGYSETDLNGTGSAAQSSAVTAQVAFGDNIWNYTNSNYSTASTFTSCEIYIPKYAGSANKVGSGFSAQEANQTGAYIAVGALLLSNTAAITSITFTPASGLNLLTDSSFYLYGIKNS